MCAPAFADRESMEELPAVQGLGAGGRIEAFFRSHGTDPPSEPASGGHANRERILERSLGILADEDDGLTLPGDLYSRPEGLPGGLALDGP